MSDTPACEKTAPGAVRVVGSVATPECLAAFATLAVAEACDVVEFRLDAFPSSVGEVRDAMALNPVDSLVTARDSREGGMNSLGWSPRRAILMALVEEAQLVDIEIENLSALREVGELAREHGVKVVASFHDFHGMPTLDSLRARRDEAAAAGADIVKYAVTPKTSADLAALASLLEEPSPVPLSLMGMGPLGRVSRLLCGQLGSVLNYGYLDAATVPGQWPAAELRRLLDALRTEPQP